MLTLVCVDAAARPKSKGRRGPKSASPETRTPSAQSSNEDQPSEEKSESQTESKPEEKSAEDEKAVEKEPIRHVTVEKKLHVSGGTDFFYLRNESADLSGFGLGAALGYSFLKWSSVALGYRHGFGVRDGIHSSLSEIDLKFSFALSGSLRSTIDADLRGKRVIKAKLVPMSGMRVVVNVCDYLLYGSTKISSLIGAGLGFYYEIGTKNMMTFSFGVRLEKVIGTGGASLTPFTLWSSVSIPL